MISPVYFCYAVLGGLVQLGVIWTMRAKGWPFLWVLPAILIHQFLFTAAYAKAPNFVAQWFLTAALTGLASFVMGVTLFGDKLSAANVSGILMVVGGLALLKLG
jgi:multidrug transporter EmrE-like cation transporter